MRSEASPEVQLVIDDRPQQTVSVDEIAGKLRTAGVKYVFGAYVDVHGVPKSKCVPIAHLADMAAGSGRTWKCQFLPRPGTS